MGGRDWGPRAPGLGQEAIRQAGNQLDQPQEGVRLELEAEQEHAAGWEVAVSELQFFTAPLLQPPASNTLSKAGA